MPAAFKKCWAFTSAGSFASRNTLAHSSLWMTVSKMGLRTFDQLHYGFEVIGEGDGDTETEEPQSNGARPLNQPVIQSEAMARAFGRRIQNLLSGYWTKLSTTASAGSIAPHNTLTHSSLWMTVSKKGLRTFAHRHYGFEGVGGG
jgi:hypothetical protein